MCQGKGVDQETKVQSVRVEETSKNRIVSIPTES
jgi:hypothetical protein